MSAETEAVKFLLQALKETVTDYIDLKSGYGQELQKLNDELRLLEAFLEDSATRYEKKQVLFKEMERQIRELVYDVEDIIQICHTRKAAAKAKNFINRNVEKLSTNNEQQVKSLRQKRVKPLVDKITEDFGKIQIPDGSSSQIPAPGTELQDVS